MPYKYPRAKLAPKFTCLPFRDRRILNKEKNAHVTYIVSQLDTLVKPKSPFLRLESLLTAV